MSYRFLIVFFSFLTSTFSLFSQRGPGGVGDSTNNPLWLRADSATSTKTNGSPISFWNDISRNENHVSQTVAAQQPIFRTNVMNGYPSIEFDNNSAAGQNDFLSGASDSSLDNTSGLSIFAVTRRNHLGNARSIVAKRIQVGVDQSYMFFFWTNDYMNLDVVSNNDRFTTNPVTFGTGTDYLVSSFFDGSLAAAQRAKIYRGETHLVTSSESSAFIPAYNSPLLVGITHNTDNRPYGGFISEIIIYRKMVNIAERIIINNYLSAKYNIPLDSNDVYTMDDASNGNFDHDVAGIGRINASNLNNDAQGTGMVRISNPSDLNNNEFMMWGHNNGIALAINNSDIPTDVQSRFDRVWRVSEVDLDNNSVDVGSVDITWDLSGFNPVNASHLRLLVDINNNGDFFDDTPISGAVSLGNGIFRFNGVTALANGIRFTLGTSNSILTPLPVELTSFKATKINENTAQITWNTSMEINNSHFTILKSLDGQNWTELGIVQGNGNSDQNHSYEIYDYNLKSGLNYYKLIQTDFDGKSKEHGIRVIESGIMQNQVIIQPNPSDGVINLQFSTLVTGGNIEILNTLGQVLYSESYKGSEYSINLPETSGIYLVRVSFNGQVQTLRVVRN